MRFFTFLAAAVLPFSALAIPASAPVDASVIETRETDILSGVLSDVLSKAFVPTPVERTPLAPNKVILPRANTSAAVASLGDLLGDLLPSLKALIGLLNSNTINEVKTVIDGLATILGNGRAGRTGDLLDDVGGLINEDLINSLKGALPGITSLLSKDNINTINNLLKSAGSLLTKENINKIQSLVTNANSLLTENFVKQTVGLINDVAPLVSAISQIITTLIQAILG